MFSNLIAIFKVPEVPKKAVPEEKKPVPVPKKKEVPPAKGIHHSHNMHIEDFICLQMAPSRLATPISVCATKTFHVLYVDVAPYSQNLTINNVFKVPEIPKKPEEKVPVPIPKKEKAPPTKGTAHTAAIDLCGVIWGAIVIPAPWQC